MDAAIRRVAPELESRWEHTWLPEIQTHLAALHALDLRGASLPELLQHLAEVKRRVERLWELHFELVDPVMLAISDFEDAYRDLFPDAKPFDPYELLAGFPNKLIEGTTRLWELGRVAVRSPALRALIIESEPVRLPAALAESPEGRALWSELQSYLRTYGERNDDLYIDAPTWIDDPTSVLRSLREAVLQPDRDLAEELREQAKQRESRLAAVRAELASHPRAVLEEFEALLKAAQIAAMLRDEHHFWIDCKITFHARRVTLELGKRLSDRDVLDSPGDVFDLTLAECSALGDPEAPTAYLRTLIAERRAERTRYAGITPPPFLGVPRPLPAMDSAFMKAIFKLSGSFMGPPVSGSELRGMPGSRGKVTGPACIVRTLEEAAKLKRGDILVAPTTLPSWTPFFVTAAAVVTGSGGILSHAAVVAREYGIPAVVGARGATEAIRDGQIIEVDGDAGIVRIVAS
jgi:pyruvate,water dikinase